MINNSAAHTTFAFLTHPISIQQVKQFWPLTRLLPESFIRPFLKNESFKIIPLKQLKDKQGNTLQGSVIITPIHPDDVTGQDDETVFDKILSAAVLSEKMGFKILGLGGYYAALADRKPMIYKHVDVPVTTGSAFTAWSVYEAAFKAAKKNKLDLGKATVTILSPVNAIGLLCARKFANNVERIILSADNEERLEKMRTTTQADTLIHVDIENNITKAVAEADIVINADSLNAALFDPDRLKPNSIVCDISVFHNIAERARQRRGITAIDCKQIATPFTGRMGFYLDLPDHTICPGLAETILLAFEENFVNYSLGEQVNPYKMDYIANAASRHGFEVLVPGAEIV